MRNLKKVLSLALAMVMLLGMMVIGAGAVETSFADNDKVGETYKEAVAVMTEVGVLTGKENNNFDPEGTLTRAEAAAILVRVTMGTEAAKGLAGIDKSSVFTDVKGASGWAAGYVDACYNKGIVGGIGNSLYAPDSKLTGTQFAAMLMRAAGVEGDFTGSSWESAVIAAAAKAKLSEVTTGEISRQAAAKMAFDGILYSPSGEKTYTVGNLTFDNFLEAYIAADGDVKKIETSTASDSLAKSVLGLTETTKNDAFGNPQKVWQVDGKDKVTVPGVKADKTYTEKKSSLTDDFKGYSFKGAKKIVDGVETAISDSTDAATVASTIAGLTGNGVEVSVYASNKVISKVVVVNPYVGEVTRVTEASGDTKRSVTVYPSGLKFETEDFAKGDWVVYTKTKNDSETIRSMYLANVIEGVTVTRTTGSTSFVADGETYKYTDLGTGKVSNPSVNNVIDVYTDQYGYTVRFDVNKGYSDFAYVADKRSVSGYGGTTWYAILVMTDGTVMEDVNLGTTEPTVGDIVTFTKNAKDVYTLEVEANKATPGPVTIDSGKTGMTLDGGTVYANNRTIFLLENNVSGEWTAYTGYTNVPSIAIPSGGDCTVRKSGTLASIVVVRNAPVASNTNLFVLKTTSPEHVTDEDGTYYVYPAVVDGEITTVKLNSNSFTAGKVYNTVAYANKDAEIINISACKLNAPATEVSNTVKTAYAEGIIVLNPNTTKSVADDVEVYKLSDTAISASSIDEINAGDSVVAVEENGELVTVFYSAKGTGGSTGETYSVSVTGSTANMTYTITDGTTTKNNEALTGIAKGKNVTVTFKANASYIFDNGEDTYEVKYTGITANQTATAPAVKRGVQTIDLAIQLGTGVSYVKINGADTPYGDGASYSGNKGSVLVIEAYDEDDVKLTSSDGVFAQFQSAKSETTNINLEMNANNNYRLTLNENGDLFVTADSGEIAEAAFDDAKARIESRTFDLYYKVETEASLKRGPGIQYFDNPEGLVHGYSWSAVNPWVEVTKNGVTYKYNKAVEESALRDFVKTLTANEGEGYELNEAVTASPIGIKDDLTGWSADSVGPTKVGDSLEFTRSVTVFGRNMDGTLNTSDIIGYITVKYKLTEVKGQPEDWKAPAKPAGTITGAADVSDKTVTFTNSENWGKGTYRLYTVAGDGTVTAVSGPITAVISTTTKSLVFNNVTGQTAGTEVTYQVGFYGIGTRDPSFTDSIKVTPVA